MQENLYRKDSIARISSPEQLNDYLKVTKPAVWIVLIAVIVLLIGLFVWGAFTYIGSRVSGEATVKDGEMTIVFENNDLAGNIREGMNITAGGTVCAVKRIYYEEDGSLVVLADTDLSNGSYDAVVEYRTTQLLRFLFRNETEEKGTEQ